MPLYDYDCAACGRRFEVIHGVNDSPPEQCPLCGSGPVRKAFAAPAIHFKGSGWAKKERRSAVKSGSSTDSEKGPDTGSDKGSEKGSDGDGSSKSTEKSSTSKGDSSSTSGSSSSAGSTAPASGD